MEVRDNLKNNYSYNLGYIIRVKNEAMKGIIY